MDGGRTAYVSAYARIEYLDSCYIGLEKSILFFAKP